MLLYKIQILLPDVGRQQLLAFFVCPALCFVRTVCTFFRGAAVAALAVPVGGRVPQNASVRAAIGIGFRVIGVIPQPVLDFLSSA